MYALLLTLSDCVCGRRSELHQNEFSGALPTELSLLTGMTTLNICCNPVRPPSPPSHTHDSGRSIRSIRLALFVDVGVVRWVSQGICGTDETKPSVGNVGTEYVAGSGGTTTSWGSVRTPPPPPACCHWHTLSCADVPLVHKPVTSLVSYVRGPWFLRLR